MPVKFTNGIDLDQTSLINAVLHPVTSDPSTPVDGQVWYRSDTDVLHIRANGVTETVAFSSGSGVPGSTWDAQSYVKAIVDNTPVVQVVANSEFVGRPAAGDIGVITAAQGRTILNVEDGSTADQTAGEILAALLTVDGTGSGLDADLLDGNEAAFFASQAGLDAAIQGITWKSSVRAATTANITLSAAQTVDGVSLIAGDRCLVQNQTSGEENGLYDVAAGAWTRSTDADSVAELEGMAVSVQEGTVNGDLRFHLITDNFTLDTTPLVYAQYGRDYVGSAAIDITGNIISVLAASIADAMLVSTFNKTHAEDIGDGAATQITVTHSFGTLDVVPRLREISSGEFVVPDAIATSINAVRYDFAIAPTTDQYRAIIQAPHAT